MALFENAKKVYEDLGVDVEAAFNRVNEIPVSLHCWQGDDVKGFESDEALSGGIAVTGNYPGVARNADELRKDIEKVLSLLPGKKRLNLHALYAEYPNHKKVGRNELTVDNFKTWMSWAKNNNLALDFNPSFFSHPKAAGGFTLSSPDAGIRKYWIEHGVACIKIAEEFGKAQKDPAIINFWVPDGFKDTPYDRFSPRKRLAESLDKIFSQVNQKYSKSAVESKLFGIGAESCTVGSHEFYMGYALKNNLLVCLDAGHFHPTEVISDKLSSVLLFAPELLLHVSRGVRWDSDHVITLNDELQAIGQEIIRNKFDKKVHVGLDYFDASINRIAAWTIGARNMYKSLLMAALEPADLLKKVEKSGSNSEKLAMMEEVRTLPFGAIWEEYCCRCNVPGAKWFDEVKKYEQNVLAKRK